MKVKCRTCKTKKSLTSEFFHPHKTAVNGFRIDCKECIKGINKAYYKYNKESVKGQVKKYAAKNKAKIKVSREKYYVANKSVYLARASARKKHVKVATPEWSDLEHIARTYKWAKIMEGRTGKAIHIDHIIPLRGKLVCGLHVPENLQLMFAEDNMSKGNKFEVEI